MTQPDNNVALADLPMSITIFENTSATRATRRDMTWGAIVRMLTSPETHATKRDCRLIKLATFGDQRSESGSLRTNDNMLEVFGVEADYDGEEIGVDEARDRLEAAGVEAFVYTTASHHPTKPRWRVLVPLSQAYDPKDRRALIGKVSRALGGILAHESFTRSQCYYFGQVEGVQYEVRHAQGRPIDCVSLEPLYPDAVAVKVDQGTGEAEDVELDRDAALGRACKETLEDLRSALTFIPADDRSTWINMGHALASLKRTEFSDEARELWDEWGKTSDKHDPNRDPSIWNTLGGDRSDYRAVFAEAARHGWVNPRSAASLASKYEKLEDRTDAGNANVLMRLTDGDLRFVSERGVWLVWDGQRWEVDEHGSAAQRAALGVGEHWFQQAEALKKRAQDPALSEDDRTRLERFAKGLDYWARRCRSKRSLDAMLAIVSRDARCQLSVKSLDQNHYLLGVENGVVDLRTGQLRPNARDEFVTKRCPVAYRPGAQSPLWIRFIDEITGLPIEAERDPATGKVQPETVGRYTQRPEMATYLKRALGYSVTGSVVDHKMFILIGAGSNGKNVLLDTVQEVCGPYSHTIAPEALMATRHEADAERPSPTLASLAGVRAAISGESKDGQRLDVGLIKRHTGGGFMTARLMRENTFRFPITHKLWLMTNHTPRLDHLDEALRGRLHLIRFERRWNRPAHPARDPGLPDGDKDMMAKLRAEGEGILAWLIDGAVEYFKHGLEPPVDVVRSTQDYFHAQDDLAGWLASCETCPPEAGATAATLFAAFQKWCQEEGSGTCPCATQKAFSQALQTRGIPNKRRETGQHYGLSSTARGRIPDG